MDSLKLRDDFYWVGIVDQEDVYKRQNHCKKLRFYS